MRKSLICFSALFKAATLLVLTGSPAAAKAQLKSLSKPELVWAAFHPFAAIKVRRIQHECDKIYDQPELRTRLDNFQAGGKLDAYRHIFYMASFAQKVRTNKIRRLGRAHEKGNYKQFRKNQLEEGERPDSLSTVMDLRNNETGLSIGCNNRNLTARELSELVISEINEGAAWILLRNERGEYVTCDGDEIDFKKYAGRWYVPKCLKRSHQVYRR